MQLFIVEMRAKIQRFQVRKEETPREEQEVRSSAVAVAAGAYQVAEEFVARNAKMTRRIAGLRANVEVRRDDVRLCRDLMMFRMEHLG